MLPFNYHHLYYFYVIAKSGSITEASKELLLAQSTLSEQLRQFEVFLDRPLFERKKKRLILTEDGRKILDYAESIFEMGQALQDMLRDEGSEGRMSVQIGALNGVARACTHELIKFILEKRPSTHVVLVEGSLNEMMERLRTQQIDALLCDGPVHSQATSAFTNTVLGELPLCFMVKASTGKRYQSFPRDFQQAPFILPAAPSYLHQAVHDFLAKHKVQPHIVAEVQDVEIARRMALSGLGIAPMNALTAARSLPKNALTCLPVKGLESVKQTFYLVTRPRKWHNPIVELIQESFRLQI